MFDLIIKNGKIIDGTGSPFYCADIALKDGRIARIGNGLENAARVIDATGLTVTPGFIDSHAHNDRNILTFPEQIEKIEQGITTSIAGACGTSDAPLAIDYPLDLTQAYGEYGTHAEIHRTMGTYLDTVTRIPQGSNTLLYVGHNALRRAAMGSQGRAPTQEELKKMCALLRDGMEHGALGVSFGLTYAPSCYADADELIALSRVAAEYHGIVSAHIRNESDHLVQALEEFITVLRESGARGVASHQKSAGKENWGKVRHTMQMIEDANAAGVELYCDVYPYNASHTTLSATIVPKHLHAGGRDALLKVLESEEGRKEIRDAYTQRYGSDFTWIQITICAAYPEYEGKTVPEIARLHGKDEIDTMCDIIYNSKNVCSACYFNLCEQDIETVIAYPRSMICTDSGVAGSNRVYHPRLRGSFPRALAKYTRERGVVSLPEMIRKMTAMPAAVYRLAQKGLLREGMDADICIFDADRIQDHATFADCSKRATGLHYVILGGEVVVENAVFNGKCMGRVLRYRA